MDGYWFPEFCNSMGVKVEKFRKWSSVAKKYHMGVHMLSAHGDDGYEYFSIREMKNDKWHVVKVKEVNK